MAMSAARSALTARSVAAAARAPSLLVGTAWSRCSARSSPRAGRLGLQLSTAWASPAFAAGVLGHSTSSISSSGSASRTPARLISAILRLTDAGWRKPVTRAAEGDHGLRADDRRHVPDHPPRPAWLFYWLIPYPNSRHDLAEFPLAAALGLLRDLHLSHRQPALSVPAADPRPGADPRTLRRAGADGSTGCCRSAGGARPRVARLETRHEADGHRDHSRSPFRCIPSSRGTSRWRRRPCGTPPSSGRISSPAPSSAASPR